MKGVKREGKGRDFYNHSLTDSPLYKGIFEDLGRDWAINSFKHLLSIHENGHGHSCDHVTFYPIRK